MGREEIIGQLSPMEALSYYYFIKYPQRRDVEISALSGIKVSTLVSTKRKLTRRGLLDYRSFPFSFSQTYPHLFLLTVEGERAENLLKCRRIDVPAERDVQPALCFNDGRSTSTFLYAGSYTDFFWFKREFFKMNTPPHENVTVKEFALRRDSLVAVNLFDHSWRVIRALRSGGDNRGVERLMEEEASPGDNEMIFLPEVSAKRLGREEEVVLNALFRAPTSSYIELSRKTGINRQRISKIKKHLDAEIFYRAYVDPFSTLQGHEIVVLHAVEFISEVEGKELISTYKEMREKLREYNLLFLHSGDVSVLLEIYPSYGVFRRRTLMLDDLFKKFRPASHHTQVMTPEEGFKMCDFRRSP